MTKILGAWATKDSLHFKYITQLIILSPDFPHIQIPTFVTLLRSENVLFVCFGEY